MPVGLFQEYWIKLMPFLSELDLEPTILEFIQKN